MKYLVLLSLIVFSISSPGKMKIYTTTTNLADIVRQVGGDLVEVESLCKGTQDPHFLEAKPSYTFKLSKADLLVSIGAGLEEGWLPLVVRGSRNPKIRAGESRYLIVSSFINLHDKADGNVSRAMGDVHPEGNPHFMLGPSISILVGKIVLQKLQELDSEKYSVYSSNFKSYQSTLQSKIKRWKEKFKKKAKVVSYHKTLSYFYKEFGIENVAVLEPKPGVPPSASHILGVIRKMKKENVHKIIIENYFDDSIAKRIKKEIPDVEIEVVPVAVNGKKNVSDLINLYEYLVSKIGS